MPRITKDDWKAWNEEQKHYAKRETQGLTADMKALEDHIKKLREVAPKDSAGYPHTRALMVLSDLQQRVDETKRYLASVA